MHAARRGDAGRAERSLAEAGRIADTARVTDLDYIDHLTDQAAWIYRAMGKHGKAADALREAIRLCGRHEGEKRYYHVRISTWLFLAEILEDAGERERAGKAKAVARALIARSPWPIAPEDPILMSEAQKGHIRGVFRVPVPCAPENPERGKRVVYCGQPGRRASPGAAAP